jgi:uncharacterized protein (DUF486 family)
MSFKLGIKGIQEILVLALMIFMVFALFYAQMDLTLKIGMAVIVFSVILLTTMATEALKQDKEQKRLKQQ